MATWIGGAWLHTRGYAMMLRWLTGIISGNGSRPKDNIEKVTGRPLITFQDIAGRTAHAWTLRAAK
jgi:hypothetical protein